MTAYNVTYRCGHQERIYGPTRERAWRRERAAEMLCRECSRAQREHNLSLPRAQNTEASND